MTARLDRQRPRGGDTANIRLLAARVVASVLGGESLTTALPAAITRAPSVGRGQLRDLCYGTLRWQPRLTAILELLLRKPLAGHEMEVKALALVGLYGLIHTRAPAYATVSETVAATRELKGKAWASGLVNAVLRSFQRRQSELLGIVDAIPEARYAHPTWLLESLQRDWPDHWQSLVETNNEPAPMVLRVALDRCSRTQYLALLARHGVSAEPHPKVASAVVLTRPCEVSELPGFDQGMASVQDGAAQIAAWLLDCKPGQRVLDACAAPGGKTGQILELQPGLSELVAIDKDAARLRRVEETLVRLTRRATLVRADAGRPEDWWDGRPFDRILLDAPCSATGVIRRHPDIKLLRRPGDIRALAAQQRELLRSAWKMLTPGGILVYATCSLLKPENCEQIENFLAEYPDACTDMPPSDWGRPSGAGRQILAGDDDMDGFYYARVRKSGSGRQ